MSRLVTPTPQTQEHIMSNEPKCPFHGSRTTAAAQSNSNWS
jgi:hypothetical protein